MVFLSKKNNFFLTKLQFLRGWVVFLVPFFVIFLWFFHAKFQFFARLGGLFELKKIFFLNTKLHCGSGWSFWVKKMSFFWDFLESLAAGLCGAKRALRTSLGVKRKMRKPCTLKPALVSVVWGKPMGRSAQSARGLTRDLKAVSGKPEDTSRCGYETLSLFAADLLLPSLWSEWSESEKWSVLGPLFCMKLLYVIGGVLT